MVEVYVLGDIENYMILKITLCTKNIKYILKFTTFCSHAF